MLRRSKGCKKRKIDKAEASSGSRRKHVTNNATISHHSTPSPKNVRQALCQRRPSQSLAACHRRPYTEHTAHPSQYTTLTELSAGAGV